MTATGYVIRKGRVSTDNKRTRLGKTGQVVRFQRVGNKAVFSGPVDTLPKDVMSAVNARLGLVSQS